MRIVQEEHDQRIQELRKKLTAVRTEWNKVDVQVSQARGALAQDYNDAKPDAASETFATRDPLKGLSKARAAKSKADNSFKDAYAGEVRPLESELERLEAEERNIHRSMAALNEGLDDKLFDALPNPPTAQWKTDSDGKQTLTVPQDEPWCIWALATRRVATTVVTDSAINPATGRGTSVSREGGYQTTVFRWIVIVPDALDAAGSLCFDHTNVFNGSAAAKLLPIESVKPILMRE